MKLNKLDKAVLKLWYIRGAVRSLVPVGVFLTAVGILKASEASEDLRLALLTGIGIPAALLLAIALILPALRYKMYAWGYDDKRIIVKEGVIFRKRVVIPVCQIQDLLAQFGNNVAFAFVFFANKADQAIFFHLGKTTVHGART